VTDEEQNKPLHEVEGVMKIVVQVCDTDRAIHAFGLMASKVDAKLSHPPSGVKLNDALTDD
jgi:hypothetical protein